MSKKAKIETKVLRKFIHIKIQEIDTKTEEIDSNTYCEIGGALLIPVSEADRFNSSSSTISRMIQRGDLIPYHNNGTIKKDNSSSRVYYDLYEWMNIDKNKL